MPQSKDQTTILATGWVVVRPDGTARGARAVRCEVREIGGEG